MSNNFDFLNWIKDNRTGPYSKDSAGKKMLNESVEEAMDLTPPSPENIYAPEEQTEQDFYDRAWGLAGMQIKRVIDDLRGDGFEDDEIMDIFRTSVEMYDQAFSGMEENKNLKEYEKACVQRGNYYYVVNDEGDTVSGPYYDSDCTRRAR